MIHQIFKKAAIWTNVGLKFLSDYDLEMKDQQWHPVGQFIRPLKIKPVK